MNSRILSALILTFAVVTQPAIAQNSPEMQALAREVLRNNLKGPAIKPLQEKVADQTVHELAMEAIMHKMEPTKFLGSDLSTDHYVAYLNAQMKNLKSQSVEDILILGMKISIRMAMYSIGPNRGERFSENLNTLTEATVEIARVLESKMAASTPDDPATTGR